MATNTFPLGKPEEAKKSEGNTAQEKREAAQTKEPAKSNEPRIPQDVNKDVWEQAEQAVRNKNGGFAGISPEGKRAQIQEMYDQMVDSDKQTKKWAGDSNLLGDQ